MAPLRPLRSEGVARLGVMVPPGTLAEFARDMASEERREGAALRNSCMEPKDLCMSADSL